MQDAILKAMNWRYSVNVFDSSKKVSADDLKTILDAGRLAPSSYGMEAWKFIVVKDSEVRARLQEAGYGQGKISEASDLVVLTYRTDLAENIGNELIERIAEVRGMKVEDLEGLKGMFAGAVGAKVAAGELVGWAKSQTYIALGVMVETAALLGVDAGPMEGFGVDQVNEILGLKAKNLSAVSMLALGYRGEDQMSGAKKVRRDYDEVVEVI